MSRRMKLSSSFLVSVAVASASTFAVALGLGMAAAGDAHADPYVDAGNVQAVYGALSVDQAEQLSTAARIQSVAANGSPMAIWEALEHGESVECMECIPSVAPLLYDGNVHTREIAAWWLRRRIFGVFGDGEVYQSTITTLQSDASATKRANAASALGEFLHTAGIAPVATALTTDADPGVRAAAAAALGRLNDDGTGALGKSMADANPAVKLAALSSAMKINSYSDAVSVVKLLGDTDATVRRRTAEALESLASTSSAASLATIAQTDSDEQVRIAACHALGVLGDASVTPVLNAIVAKDSSSLVRDMASMALLRL